MAHLTKASALPTFPGPPSPPVGALPPPAYSAAGPLSHPRTRWEPRQGPAPHSSPVFFGNAAAMSCTPKTLQPQVCARDALPQILSAPLQRNRPPFASSPRILLTLQESPPQKERDAPFPWQSPRPSFTSGLASPPRLYHSPQPAFPHH